MTKIRTILALSFVLLLCGFQENGCEAIEADSVEVKEKMRGIEYITTEIFLIDANSSEVISGSFDPDTSDDCFLAASVPYSQKSFTLDGISNLDPKVEYIARVRHLTRTGAKSFFSRPVNFKPQIQFKNKPLAIATKNLVTNAATGATIWIDDYGLKAFDEYDAMNITSGVYTIPRKGIYEITFRTSHSVQSGTAGPAYIHAKIERNSGVSIVDARYWEMPAGIHPVTSTYTQSFIIPQEVGTELRFGIELDTGARDSLSNFFQVKIEFIGDGT